MKYYCDTNFIICYLLGNNQDKLMKTKEIFEQIKTGKASLTLEQTVFAEIVFTLSLFYNVLNNKISELLAYRGVVCEDKDSLLLALSLYSNHEMGIVDCLLAAKAKMSNTEILSYNQKLIDCYQKESH